MTNVIAKLFLSLVVCFVVIVVVGETLRALGTSDYTRGMGVGIAGMAVSMLVIGLWFDE